MKRMPTLKQLYHLTRLYEHQHFGKAADACFISQSTLSASIIQLEEILGVQLLERDHKNFIFTTLGKGIVEKSRSLLESCQELVDFAQYEGKPMHGMMRLGCIPTIAPFIMSKIVLQCKEQYPALTLLIQEDTTDNLLNALDQNKLDLVILALPYPTKKYHTEILCRDPFYLIMPASWENKPHGKNMDAWPDESIFFLEKENCLTEQTLQACGLQNSKKIHPYFASSLHTLVQMVIAELGVSIFPQLAIRSGILTHSNLIIKPLPSEAYREIGLAWRPTSAKQDSYRLFALFVKQVISRLVE